MAGTILVWMLFQYYTLYNISYNTIDGEGCEHIAEMLKFNKTLKKLVLSSNLVDNDGIGALVQGLGVNSSIHTLV